MTVSTVAAVGVVEIALGVLGGWSLVAAQEVPAALHHARVRSPGELHRAHIAALMMGAALAGTGAAVEVLPLWTTGLLCVAGLVDPLLFVALAFRVDKQRSVVYRGVSALVFLALSVGFCSAATIAVLR